jgi:DNA (cytosine-5)-methyltransferase 1
MMNYYNEIDPYAAQWLRNLIAARLIPDGVVDARSIVEVQPHDLTPYTQCHFFAGIAGWAYALQLAGWPADRSVWTGSCPCQPFSCAGKHKGTADSRHLWPEFHRLIAACCPGTVFGEQVASKDGLRWLDGVFADLEGADYTCGACDICAAGVGAPHIRQRLYWMAHTGRPSLWDKRQQMGGTPQDLCREVGQQRIRTDFGHGGNANRLAHPQVHGRDQRRATPDGRNAGARCVSIRLADDDNARPQGRPPVPQCPGERSPWTNSLVIPCRDGKARRISAEPSDVPLAHGIPRDVGRVFPELAGVAKDARHNRVGRLKGYGNAIVPQVAAEFIRACMEMLP